MFRSLAFSLFFFLLLPGLSSAEEARYYEKLPDGSVQCGLCPRACSLKEGQTGICGVRKNFSGKLESTVYARPCSINIDPVEKKPLFHFLPGTEILSVATPGCNLRCVFCQNWSISQADPSSVRCDEILPEDIAALAASKRCPSIAYTYSEPTVFFEYMLDTSLASKKRGLKNVWITCGYINPGPLKELCRVIDAANVDLKGFSDAVYRKIGGARLAPVLETLKILKENGVWVEVGYLVIPTVNDSPEEIRAMCEWTAKNLGRDVPVHFLRFFPQHRLTNLPPTPVKTLEQCCETADRAGLNYVYIGNLPGHPRENTRCPGCGKTVIERSGFFLKNNRLRAGKCPYCGRSIAGVWK